MESTAQTVVNTVNCVGVMGKGLAQAFKEREPDMFAAYKSICDRGLLEPGKLWLWQASDQWVLNFPTKKHWRNPSRLEWIEAGLDKFVREYAARGIREISFPRLGCGNGNLDWRDVQPLMEHYLSALDIPVYIHDFEVDIGLPEHLEHIASQLRSEVAHPSTFDAFLKAIARVADLAGGQLEELDSRRRFELKVAEDEVEIRTSEGVSKYETDDLRGVWISLLTGLITKQEAGWSDHRAGDAMLSILSLLPDTRAIQVQAGESEPEVAVELKPATRKNVLVPPSKEPLMLSWH